MKVKCIKNYKHSSGVGVTEFTMGKYYDANQPCPGLSGSTINIWTPSWERYGENIFEVVENNETVEDISNGMYSYKSPYLN